LGGKSGALSHWWLIGPQELLLLACQSRRQRLALHEGLPVPASHCITTQRPASDLLKPKRQALFIITKLKKPSPSDLSMPRKSNTVKAAKLLWGKSGAKVIKWETRVHSRGIRDVPVEVIATTSQLRPRKMARRQPRTEENDTSQGETAPQPMDISDTFWVEEPAMPTSKKSVRQPVLLFLANLTYLPAPGLH